MADRILVRINQGDVARAQLRLRLSEVATRKAMEASLNKQARAERKWSIDEGARDVNLTKTFLRGRIDGPDQKPGNKARLDRLVSKVTAPRRGLRLSHFARANQTRLQDVGGRQKALIQVKVKRGGALITMRSAFYLRLRRGTQAGTEYGIFVRRADGLKHLHGPSPSQIFNREIPVILQRLEGRLRAQLEIDVAAQLLKLR